MTIFQNNFLAKVGILLTALFFGTATILQAQNLINVQGLVKNAAGLPLAKATVKNVSSPKYIVATDSLGDYSIKAKIGDYLEFSFVGYYTKKFRVSYSTLNVLMEENENYKQLNEVVVVGYGKQKVPTITGAISTISGSDLAATPVANLSNMLVGRSSGLSSVQASGEPGQNTTTIHIRGVASLNGTDPLIVIDGVQQPAEQPYAFFDAIDPNDIEGVTILKDASSTAVYGIRGANGVIIVTTKRGQINRPVFSLGVNQAFTKANSLFQTIGSYEFGLLRNEAITNADASGDYSYDSYYFSDDQLWKFKNNRDYTEAEVNALNLTDAKKAELKASPALYYTSNNYYKKVFGGIGQQQQYTLNVSGGTEKVKYFNAVSFFHQNGILTNTSYGGANNNPSYNRYNFRSNFDINIIKNVTMSINLSGQEVVEKLPGSSYSGSDIGDRYQSIIQDILERSPFSGPGIVDGKLVTSFLGDAGSSTNPLSSFGGTGYSPTASLITDGFRTYYISNLSGAFNLVHTMNYLLPGLSIHAKVAYDDSYTRAVAKSVSIPTYSAARNPSDPTQILFVGGTVGTTSTSNNVDNSTWRKIYLESGIDYNHSFGGHNVTALLLANAQKYTASGMTDNTPSGLVGMAARATYNFKEKYLLEVNMAYNGTEQFAKSHRFGFFPAVSLGWVLSNESFFPKNDILNYVKFRGSYGEVGSDKLGSRRYLYMSSSWTYGGYGYYWGATDGSSKSNYYYPAEESTLGNPNVTWERAKKLNISGDFKFLDNRFSLTATYFSEKRNNILVSLGTIPDVYGVSSSSVPPANLGKIENHGLELELSWNDQIGEVKYWSKLNWSFAKNKIIYEAEAPYAYSWMNETGFSVGQYKGLRTNGFYNTQEELNNRPYNSFGNKARLGDLKFVDINGDGIIDDKDEVPIGYSNLPQISYNFSFGFSYKGWDFSALIIGTARGSFPQYGYILSTPFAKNVGEVLQTMYDGRWTQDKYLSGKKITYPEITFSGGAPNNGVLSDFWLKSSNFMRLKNAQLAYTFTKLPKFFKQNLAFLKAISFYANGNNLLTWGTHLLKGIDPEQADTGKNNQGYLYPLTRTYNVGMNIKF